MIVEVAKQRVEVRAIRKHLSARVTLKTSASATTINIDARGIEGCMAQNNPMVN